MENKYRKSRRGRLILMAAPGTLVISFFFIMPLGMVTQEAFTNGASAFKDIFADSVFWKGLGGTLVIGLTPKQA